MEGDVDGGASSDSDFSEDTSETEELEPSSSGDDHDHDHDEHTFDMALPVKHAYLGTDLEELSGRTMLDDDSYQSLPLLPQPGVVLVPGQTLPLTVFYPPTISMLRNTIANDRTFGVVSVSRYSYEEFLPKLADVGTTAEIYEYREESELDPGFKIKAKGRQRFRVMETRRQIDGNVLARVKILPEVVLPDPLQEVRLVSLDHHRTESPSTPRPTDKLCTEVKRKQPSLRLKDGCLTYWPHWVYRQYDINSLVSRMRKELKELNLTGSQVSLPKDPVELSFWVAQNLPLEDGQRLSLLRLNSAIQRLRWELSVLEKCQVLCCRECQSKVADQRDVFSMSVEGPQGTYVNPGGYVHETLTLHRVKGLRLVDEPSTEYSWFPGYAWTIAECGRCRHHMGWRFTATNRQLKPDKFWGICRRSLLPKLQTEDEGELRPVM